MSSLRYRNARLSAKYFKEAIIKKLQQRFTCTLEANENIKSLSEKIKDIKKNQTEISKLKNTITK